MKKFKFFLIFGLLISLLFALCSCATKRLATPSNIDLTEENVLTWSEVDGAEEYRVEIYDWQTEKTTVEITGKEYYDFSTYAEGDYDIRLQAVGDGYVFRDSHWTEIIEFQKKYQTGCIYKLIDGRTAYEISRAGKATGEVYIEDEYRGKPVTTIADSAFRAKKTITKIVVGANVTKIGKNAFYNCTKLTTVVLPEGLETLGESAFSSCAKLTEITIPSTVKEIGQYTFSYCKGLQRVTFREGLETIGKDAFNNCTEVTEIVLPDSLVSMGSGAFRNMTKLQSVKVGKNLTEISASAFEEASALTAVQFYQPTASDNNYLPALKKIGVSAFKNCVELVTISLPNGVENVGNSCFYGCVKLQDSAQLPILPSTINSIGSSAFFNTAVYNTAILENYVYVGDWLVEVKEEKKLELDVIEGATANAQTGFVVRDENTDLATNVFLLKTGTVGLADGVFHAAPVLTEINLPKSVKYIGNGTFAGCVWLRSFYAPEDSVQTIGEYAFEGCENLKTVKLKSGLKRIGSYAFKDCVDLYDKDDLIPATVNYIGTSAFINTDLWNDPEDSTGVVYAGTWVVGYNNLTTTAITLKKGTVGISNYAFYQSSITSVTRLNEVKYIGKGAFYQCAKLANVNLYDGLEKIEDYAFYKCGSLSKVQMPDDLRYIGNYAFYKCESLVTLELANTYVETIGDYAFYGCTKMTTLQFDETQTSTLKTIGDYAFYKCEGLGTLSTQTGLVIPSGVASIGERAFYKCINLQSLKIGAVETIGDYAFYGCSAIKVLSLETGVKKIGKYAFYKNSELMVLTLNSDLEEIGDFAFYDASKLTDLTLPDSISKIGKYAFKGAKNLTSITLNKDYTQGSGAGLVGIGSNAFYGCSGSTIYTNAVKTLEGNPPSEWHYRWNSSYRPVVWGCSFAQDNNGYYVYAVTITVNTFDNVKAIGGVTAPTRKNKTFIGWSTRSDATTAEDVEYTAEQIVDVPVGTTLYAIWN